MIAWNIVYFLVEVKTHGKKIEGPKLGAKLGFLPFSQGCIIRFPWYGTMPNMYYRAETSKKNFCGTNLGWSNLFNSNVVECPFKLACFLLLLSDLLIYNLDFLLIFHLALIQILQFFSFCKLILPFFISLYVINRPLKLIKYFGALLPS